MLINRKHLENRKILLENEKNKKINGLNALLGQIAETDYWLKHLDTIEKNMSELAPGEVENGKN